MYFKWDRFVDGYEQFPSQIKARHQLKYTLSFSAAPSIPPPVHLTNKSSAHMWPTTLCWSTSTYSQMVNSVLRLLLQKLRNPQLTSLWFDQKRNQKQPVIIGSKWRKVFNKFFLFPSVKWRKVEIIVSINWNELIAWKSNGKCNGLRG